MNYPFKARLPKLGFAKPWGFFSWLNARNEAMKMKYYNKKKKNTFKIRSIKIETLTKKYRIFDLLTCMSRGH